MINEQLVRILQDYPPKMKVKIRHAPLIIGDIHEIHEGSFITDDAEVEKVIVIDNFDVKEGKVK
jgi:hypothetical protein